jgi:hypothetical protein
MFIQVNLAQIICRKKTYLFYFGANGHTRGLNDKKIKSNILLLSNLNM